ncbi:hypothetical protein [Chitinophaga nivalis]|uniref:HMA domain-containing protein n=1 Tax=Chitinophaga nivalis TaxID=2991709 RepID=A0ABT3IPU1_9BACT|nr:hypothetical protein [Chitinophaga nivalis]MCW3464346.1 hypothetical protein [Chitinophaga nivalis]MCW3485963.1 hypothetical protein [Chitinophaga nivalis]
MMGIFRTNINTVQEKNNVINAIAANFTVNACSVDIEDCDKVLRVVSPQQLAEQSIIEFVTELGFSCDILD